MMRVDSWCDTPLECCYSPQGLRSVYPPLSRYTCALSASNRTQDHYKQTRTHAMLAFCCFELSLLVFIDDTV